MAGPAGLATAACGGFFNAPRSSAAAANRGEEDDDRERNDHSEKWPGDAPGVDGDLVDVVLEELFRRRRVAAQLCGGCRSSRCRRALAAQINRIGPPSGTNGTGRRRALRRASSRTVGRASTINKLVAMQQTERIRIVVSLKEHIVRQDRARQTSGTTTPRAKSSALLCGRMTEDTETVSAAASVALPGDIDLETRAARMNQFWSALVDYQHQNVIVVALTVGDER